MGSVGLIIGAIALASMFTKRIERLDQIEFARSSEKGLTTQVCKVSIVKRQSIV